MSVLLKACPVLPIVFCAAMALAGSTGSAYAADKFKVTRVDCEMFWYSKHTPVINYDIVDERKADYERNPDAAYFRQAAARTAEYCNRTSAKPQTLYGPPRAIRGVWFQSNDSEVKILYDLDRDAIDESAGVTNRIGDRFAAAARAQAARTEADARHQAQLEELRTREARAKQLREAELKARQDAIDAENAREKAFFDRRDLQIARLGAEVTQANFALLNDVRTNPFHYKKLGLAVVRTQFNKMVSDKVALFGNELAPIFVHIDDVDRFTKAGETVMLALKVSERGDVEKSYGSLPEIIVSALKAEPLFGEYVGAFTCPGGDCGHIFDVPPPS